MIVVGLTGGIGSGKTTVARMFGELGIPVYNSDDRAKELMNTSPELVKKIEGLLGDGAYKEGVINKDYIASRVFSDRKLLRQLNEIVHPAVRSDFKTWASTRKEAYVIQEAAILFENGAYENFDQMILVTAPKQLRLERIMQRDTVTVDNIIARMNHQWEDEIKRPLAHFIIENTDLEKTQSEVKEIHQKLLGLSTSKGF